MSPPPPDPTDRPADPGLDVTDVVISRGYLVLEVGLFVIIQAILRVVLTLTVFGGLEATAYAGGLVYLSYALVALAIVPGVLILSQKLLERPAPPSTATSPPRASLNHATRDAEAILQDFFTPYGVSTSDALAQVKHVVLLLLFVFLPLSALSYLVPGYLAFEAESLTGDVTGAYLLESSFLAFLGGSLFIHAFVALREETIFRNFVTREGKRYFSRESAVLIAACFFGLAHLRLGAFAGPQIGLAFVWVGTAIVLGFALSLFVLETRQVLPLVVAHWINNVLSTVMLWVYLVGGDVWLVYLLIFLPAMAAALVTGVLKRDFVRRAARRCVELLRAYFHQGKLVVLVDVGITLGLWFLFTVI